MDFLSHKLIRRQEYVQRGIHYQSILCSDFCTTIISRLNLWNRLSNMHILLFFFLHTCITTYQKYFY
ncbi:AAEL010320-PA [Aedes aegypti]|uniref:AAEL010320-PA n=1 Tax=Aedes aegypti TaxID=7159 RepID=Q0IEJ4_AEDAE|nr:AAEL010320-PA [Aedes aegypti]